MTMSIDRRGPLPTLVRGPWPVIVLSALLLLWPAFVNGYPIVGPDSVGYVGSSSVIVMRFGIRSREMCLCCDRNFIR
jgi:hypothetical protein